MRFGHYPRPDGRRLAYAVSLPRLAARDTAGGGRLDFGEQLLERRPARLAGGYLDLLGLDLLPAAEVNHRPDRVDELLAGRQLRGAERSLAAGPGDRPALDRHRGPGRDRQDDRGPLPAGALQPTLLRVVLLRVHLLGVVLLRLLLLDVRP